MKLASITFAGRPVYGRVEGDELRVPAAEFLDRYPTLASLVAANAYAEMLATDAAISVAVAEAVYEPVIPAASKSTIFNNLLHLKIGYLLIIRSMAMIPSLQWRQALLCCQQFRPDALNQ